MNDASMDKLIALAATSATITHMNSIMHSNNSISNNNNDDISDNPMHHVTSSANKLPVFPLPSRSLLSRGIEIKHISKHEQQKQIMQSPLRVVMYAQCRHDHAIVHASDYKT